jgi:anti-anti-sigma factor
MEINQRENRSIPVIVIEGEIDLYNSKILKDIIDKLIRDGKYKIVINLQSVPFIDSSGIGTIMTSMYKLRKYGGNLKVCNVFGSVARIFKMTGLETSIEVFLEEDDAISSFL